MLEKSNKNENLKIAKNLIINKFKKKLVQGYMRMLTNAINDTFNEYILATN